ISPAHDPAVRAAGRGDYKLTKPSGRRLRRSVSDGLRAWRVRVNPVRVVSGGVLRSVAAQDGWPSSAGPVNPMRIVSGAALSGA
ncbi:MAG TPA: hypothetical protein VG994_08805, partial [Steroidobacteraceae bacterium]|nr:hypothetical protein [Steroidobacteraceae bacterium]